MPYPTRCTIKNDNLIKQTKKLPSISNEMKSFLQQSCPRCAAEPAIFTANILSAARFPAAEKMVFNELSEQPLSSTSRSSTAY